MTETLHHVGRRAAVGATFVALRSFLTQAIGLAGMVVLTHELSPHQFGLIAFGLAITAFATAFGDVGLAAGLIRSPASPSRRALQGALGVQVIATTTLMLVVSVAVLPLGVVGELTALMLLSLPLGAWQTPARVVLERGLAYKGLSAVELVQSLAYWSTAIVAVVAGFGVWGVASASVVQTAVGTALLLWRVPQARFRPVFSWHESRGLVKFGAAFQAVNFTNLIRDQGLNVAVAGVLGLSALGIWNVAARMLSAPLTLFGAVWRVSYPSMAQVVRRDRKPRALLEHAVTVASLGCGLILAPLGGAGVVVVPLIFGSEWRAAGYVLAPASAALMLGGPVSLAVAGYLYAVGALRTVLWSAILHTVAWFAVALSLMPLLGIQAVGVALLVGAAVDAAVLAKGARTEAGARVLPPLAMPFAAALVAGGASFAVSISLPTTPMVAIFSIAVALFGYLGVLGAFVLIAPSSRIAAGVRLAVAAAASAMSRQPFPMPSSLDAHVTP